MNVKDVGAPLENMLGKFRLGWRNPAPRTQGKGHFSLPGRALRVDALEWDLDPWHRILGWMQIGFGLASRRTILG